MPDPELAVERDRTRGVGRDRRGRRRRTRRARTTRWPARTGPSTSPTTPSELARRVPAARTVVVNDAIGAIRCGPEDGVGCSLVCGTGTALGARAARRPPLAHELAGRADLHDRSHARDARRRRAQRARPDAAERRCRRASRRPSARRTRSPPSSASPARPAPARAPRSAGVLLDCASEGDALALDRVSLGRGRGRRVPARGGARVRPRRADADHARRRRHAPPVVAARRRAGRGAARLRARTRPPRARARGAAGRARRGRRGAGRARRLGCFRTDLFATAPSHSSGCSGRFSAALGPDGKITLRAGAFATDMRVCDVDTRTNKTGTRSRRRSPRAPRPPTRRAGVDQYTIQRTAAGDAAALAATLQRADVGSCHRLDGRSGEARPLGRSRLPELPPEAVGSRRHRRCCRDLQERRAPDAQ